jgi:hypothetical protein
MIPTPFRYEANLTPEDFQKIGQLSLRWSHTDHIIANCLKVMLRLTDEEAILMVFPLSLDLRIQRIEAHRKLKKLPPDADHAFTELKAAMEIFRPVRNFVAHALLRDEARGEQVFEFRSKGKKMTKMQIFETEELTNYASHAALVFRYALGEKNSDVPSPLPNRPRIPMSLRKHSA